MAAYRALPTNHCSRRRLEHSTWTLVFWLVTLFSGLPIRIDTHHGRDCTLVVRGVCGWMVAGGRVEEQEGERGRAKERDGRKLIVVDDNGSGWRCGAGALQRRA